MNILFEPPSAERLASPDRADCVPRHLVAEELQYDEDAERQRLIDDMIAAARAVERWMTRLALAAGVILLLVMAARTAPYIARHLSTPSPAPRPLAPQVVSNSSLTVVEAGRQPTGQVR